MKSDIKETLAKIDLLIKRARNKYIMSGIAQLIGYGLIIWQAGWIIAIGVFFLHLGINLAVSADKDATAAKLI